VARFYLDEHLGEGFVASLAALGHDALSTCDAGNKGLTDPRQLLFATHHGRTMVTFDVRQYAMLHELLTLANARRGRDGFVLHAGIMLLPSSSMVAPTRLVAALDDLVRRIDPLSDRCFRWLPTGGWTEVTVAPYAP
jgi:hypothetical protein